jgi:hypothetical protein
MNRIAISGLFVVGLTAMLVTAQQETANPKAETTEEKSCCARARMDLPVFPDIRR